MLSNPQEVLTQVLNAPTLEAAQAINTNNGAPLSFQCDESTSRFDIYSLTYNDNSLREHHEACSITVCNECECLVEDRMEGCDQCQF